MRSKVSDRAGRRQFAKFGSRWGSSYSMMAETTVTNAEETMKFSSSTNIDERSNAMEVKGAIDVHFRFVSPGGCHRDDWRSTPPRNTWTVATHHPPAD